MNKVILMGRLTKDTELRHTTTNKAVCSFTLAVDRRFQKDKTDFIPVVAWNKAAEFASKYFCKGMKIVVVGSIQTQTYESDNGKKYITEVVIDELYFAESKRHTEQVDKQEGSYQMPPDDDCFPF